jgi:crossover junction endodeoxyribonuclease RusA
MDEKTRARLATDDGLLGALAAAQRDNMPDQVTRWQETSGEAFRSQVARSWTLALPAGLPPLSPNLRLHWSVQRARARDIKQAAWALALHHKVPRLDRIAVHVTYHPPDRRRRDLDNVPPAMAKHAIDGIVAAGCIPDDAPPYVASIAYAIGSVVKGGQLVLTITAASEAAPSLAARSRP